MRRVLHLNVVNSVGVLNRITGLFRKRNFNIHSLTTGTMTGKVNTMTISLDVEDEKQIEQAKNQLAKLVDVIEVEDITDMDTVQRELSMFKVSVSQKERVEIESLTRPFRGRVLDISKDSMIIEVTGIPTKVDAFRELIDPYGIEVESRTGITAFVRGKF